MFHFTKIIAKSAIQFYMQIKKLGLAKLIDRIDKYGT